VDILGHPFGMCYRRFKLTPPEDKFHALIEKAAKTGVALEINPQYQPDPWRLIEWCRQGGARISLGSNAHSTTTVGRITRVLRGEEAAWMPSES
jgi:histidinol phosphatase-like PHP family hydrolase